MTIEKVLIVDDEMLVRDFLAETLRRKGIDVVTAEDGVTALAALKEGPYDLVVTDMKMPDITGIDILRKVKEVSPSTIVIVITAFGSVENAVDAMRLGAFNYLIKPFSPDTIEAVIEKANEHRALVAENQYWREQISDTTLEGDIKIIANSPAMKKVLEDVERAAKSNASIFICGESGTGKEVIAAAIHHYSQRADRPFIKVNCAAVPETLIESEFFGHEKGSFTGAHARRLGRFELANTGTLLLDEVTEVPVMLQAKLLRVLQEQEFERVGGTKPIHVDVRIISTTNRNIEEAITSKTLREDLYYRLNVVPIILPPLRDRPEDIIPLAEHFIAKFCQESHTETKVLDEEAKRKLQAYHWPGNVRELANIIERAVVMNHVKVISSHSLLLGNTVPAAASPERKKKERNFNVGMTLRELEKRLIIETLEAHNQNRTKAAEVLDISVRTLRNKLNEYKKDHENDTEQLLNRE
jgi:two-component system response regulator AtoC